MIFQNMEHVLQQIATTLRIISLLLGIVAILLFFNLLVNLVRGQR
jgi:hypothetical protein